jgi:hypothetical protein
LRENTDALRRLQFAAEWFDLWEVRLMTPDGHLVSVPVFARDSLSAEILIRTRMPTVQLIGVRRVSRRD